MIVSDHAILRYAERFLGLDTKAIESRIQGAGSASSRFVFLEEEQLVVVCKCGVALTVITKEMNDNDLAQIAEKKRARKKAKKQRHKQLNELEEAYL